MEKLRQSGRAPHTRGPSLRGVGEQQEAVGDHGGGNDGVFATKAQKTQKGEEVDGAGGFLGVFVLFVAEIAASSGKSFQ